MTHDSVASLLRANQAYYELSCDTLTLDGGIAFFNNELPELADANQLREVLVPNPDDLPAVFGAVEECFSEQGVRCCRWAPSMEQGVEPLSQFLTERGFTLRRTSVFALVRWSEPRRGAAVRVLPARPMQSAYRDTFGDLPSVNLAAELDRLDDPRYAAFVAMEGSTPIGRATMFECGETVRLNDVYVSPDFRSRGVGAALLSQMLTEAHRVAARVVCAQIDQSAESAAGFLETLGLVRAGEICEFDAPVP